MNSATRKASSIVLRSLVIVLVGASIGLLSNLSSSAPLPWFYNPPEEIVLEGARVPLIDETEAVRFLNDPMTVFVDSRKCPDVAKSRVRGAICLPPDDIETRFPMLEALIQPENRVILYCYGPECDMAERVATFLARWGYKNMMIMMSGFPAWQKAGFPIEVQDQGSEKRAQISWSSIDGDSSISSSVQPNTHRCPAATCEIS